MLLVKFPPNKTLSSMINSNINQSFLDLKKVCPERITNCTTLDQCSYSNVRALYSVAMTNNGSKSAYNLFLKASFLQAYSLMATQSTGTTYDDVYNKFGKNFLNFFCYFLYYKKKITTFTVKNAFLI